MAHDTWTVGRILAFIEEYLGEHGDAHARFSAQWLVAEALGETRMQLYLDLERPLTADEREVLRTWVRRRAEGEPLQYITGEVAFRHITVKVERGVLIPRPETEVLVSEALALLPAHAKPQDALDAQLIAAYEALEGSSEAEGKAAEPDGTNTEEAARAPLLVADICTGTGCIACSIAAEHPDTRILATDVAPAAVALAQRNVEALGLGDRVEVIGCDLADGIDKALMGTFDLVISNPPYIPTDVLAQLDEEVSGFEPAIALDGGPDGLTLFRRLLDWCAHALAPGGAFACELHETCLEDAAAEAEYAGFSDVRIAYDLAGKPRILTCRNRKADSERAL